MTKATLEEVMPQALALTRAEKKKLIRRLRDDIRKPAPPQTVEEMMAALSSGPPIEMWSPLEAYEAAAILQQLLDEKKHTLGADGAVVIDQS